MVTTSIQYRLASHNDETDILAVLEEVAPEVPVRLDGPDRQEKIKTEITQCHRSGKSWVAVDGEGTVVGFVLARPDVHEGQSAISVRYVGVRKNSRRRGIFSTFMEKLKANGVTLTASVLHNNLSAMKDKLMKIGFTKIESESNTTQTKLQWPPASD